MAAAPEDPELEDGYGALWVLVPAAVAVATVCDCEAAELADPLRLVSLAAKGGLLSSNNGTVR